MNLLMINAYPESNICFFDMILVSAGGDEIVWRFFFSNKVVKLNTINREFTKHYTIYKSNIIS